MASAMLNNDDQSIDFTIEEEEITTDLAGKSGRKRKNEEAKEQLKRIDIKVAKIETTLKKHEETLREIKALLHLLCEKKKM